MSKVLCLIDPMKKWFRRAAGLRESVAYPGRAGLLRLRWRSCLRVDGFVVTLLTGP